jgi:hypothetical protein
MSLVKAKTSNNFPDWLVVVVVVVHRYCYWSLEWQPRMLIRSLEPEEVESGGDPSNVTRDS